MGRTYRFGEFSIVRNLHLFDLIPELEGFRLFKFCEWEEFLYVALGFRSRGCECRISSISEFWEWRMRNLNFFICSPNIEDARISSIFKPWKWNGNMNLDFSISKVFIFILIYVSSERRRQKASTCFDF